MGMVKKPLFGRTMKLVAPNSPMLTVKAKTAATSSARPTIGKSTSRQTWSGDAPSRAAASRRDGRIPCITGSSVRTTKGKATSVWAMSTSKGDVRSLSKVTT